MLNSKNILAIIPARIGSKGIKFKNLKKVNNTTLLGHAIICLKKTKFIDRIFVSTDSKKITNEALNYNIETPFLRPKKLSGDRISDYQVVKDVLLKIERHDNKKYDVVLLIQPTSPFRLPADIIKSTKTLIKTNADSVWSVSKLDSKMHPLKQLKIYKKKISFFIKSGEKIVARQQLSDLYYRNGICYAIKRSTILNQKSVKGNFCIPLLIKRQVVNIDNYFDLKLANFLYKKS
jgi:CMP-N,N'-diacetyllegionaminic acid synthase